MAQIVKAHTRKTKKGQVRVKAHSRKNKIKLFSVFATKKGGNIGQYTVTSASRSGASQMVRRHFKVKRIIGVEEYTGEEPRIG